MTTEDIRRQIEENLRRDLAPLHLEVLDDSAAHAGHVGVMVQGGGHFRILCVSEAFEGKSLVDQHRLIHGAVGYPMNGAIHALEIKTVPASRWRA